MSKTVVDLLIHHKSNSPGDRCAFDAEEAGWLVAKGYAKLVSGSAPAPKLAGPEKPAQDVEKPKGEWLEEVPAEDEPDDAKAPAAIPAGWASKAPKPTPKK